MSLESIFRRIARISNMNIINLLHLQEESGELATEVMIQQRLINKSPGKDGVKGEAADVIVCALAILANECNNSDEVLSIIDRKVLKWEEALNENLSS